MNLYLIESDHAIVDVSTRSHPGAIAIIDLIDLPIIIGSHWFAVKTGIRKNNDVLYVVRKKPESGSAYLHRVIMGNPESLVDHRDRNGLNNRRENLRLATHLQNNGNMRGWKGTTSKFKGVSWDKSRSLWTVSIAENSKRINLGRFALEEDAARAYDVAALKKFGEFAALNFPIKLEEAIV